VQERNAASAVTAHDAIARTAKNNSAKNRGDRVSAQSARRSSVRPGATESEAQSTLKLKGA